MNRIIKFKIWLKKEKRFDYNDCFIRASGNPAIYQGEELSPDDYQLFQFTGLLDKNGTEIYFDDILEFRARDNDGSIMKERGVVKLDKAMNIIKEVKRGRQVFRDSLINSLDEVTKDGKVKNEFVIGNIWENPELLNQP